MKAAGKILFFALVAAGVQAQEFGRSELLTLDPAPRWEVRFAGALSSVSPSASWYANSELGLSYRTSFLQAGGMARFNQSQSFAFLPPRLIIRLDETDITFPENTRFRARPDQYEINYPFSIFAQVNQKHWSLFGALSSLTQKSNSERPEPEVIGDSLLIINWEPVNTRNNRLLTAIIAGWRWNNLMLKAGALNVPVAQFGDKNFKYEYVPEIAPFLALDWRYKTAQLLTFADNKTFAFEYAQLLKPVKFSNGKSIETQIGYQTGFDKFPFHALRLQFAFSIFENLRCSWGYEKVWSSLGMANYHAFESWQQSNNFGALQPLNNNLPHQSAFVTLRLGLDKKAKPWPLQLMQIKLLQTQIYRAKRVFYSQNPIGTIDLYNQREQPLRVQLVVETTNGSGIYRSEVFTINPGETKSRPFYLYLQDTGRDSVESFEQMMVSAVVENQSQILTSIPVTIYGRNAWSGNTWELKYFVAPNDPSILNRAKQLYLRAFSNSGSTGDAPAKFLRLKSFIDDLGKEVMYIPDPTSTMNLDQVQYPVETLTKGGGDCEDLVVFIASSLMAVGVQTAVVDVRPQIAENISFPTAEPGSVGHVFLLIDTGIGVEFMSELRFSDFQGITRKNVLGKPTIWIPLETTELAKGFEAAFQEGVRQYHREVIENDGATKGVVHVYDF